MRRIFVLGLAALASGCATDSYEGQRQTYGSFSSAPAATGSLATPGARPLAMLPQGAGNVLNVLEQRGTNFITQEIILSGDVPTFGENKISLTAITARTNEFVEGKPGEIDLKRATDVALYDELLEQFPTVRMAISEGYDRNGNGPFGYAIGRSKNVTCVYAWQWLEDKERSIGFFGDKSAASLKPIASVRVRMCKQGLGEQAILGFVRQLIIMQPSANGSSYPTSANYGGYAPTAGGDALAAAGGGYGAPYAGVNYNRPTGSYGAGPMALGQSYGQAAPRVRIAAKPRRKRVIARSATPQSQGKPVASWSAPQATHASATRALPPQPRVAAKPGAAGYASVPLPE